MTLHEIVHSTEETRTIVVVPLTNTSRKVKLYEDDYRELEKLGLGLPWRWNQEQVWVRNNDRNISVARLVMDADKGEKISFKDRDPANLTRSNLVRIPGSSKYRTMGQLFRVFKTRPVEIRHVSKERTESNPQENT